MDAGSGEPRLVTGLDHHNMISALGTCLVSFLEPWGDATGRHETQGGIEETLTEPLARHASRGRTLHRSGASKASRTLVGAEFPVQNPTKAHEGSSPWPDVSAGSWSVVTQVHGEATSWSDVVTHLGADGHVACLDMLVSCEGYLTNRAEQVVFDLKPQLMGTQHFDPGKGTVNAEVAHLYFRLLLWAIIRFAPFGTALRYTLLWCRHASQNTISYAS